MMRRRTPPIAAILVVALAMVAMAGVDAPQVDFKRGRDADADFDLHLEIPAKSGKRLVVAAGSTKVYAFALIGPGRKSHVGWSKGPDSRIVAAPLPAGSKGTLRCVVKVRTTVAPHISLVIDGREAGRAPLPEIAAPLRLALLGGEGAKVIGYQKIARSDPVLFTDDFMRAGPALGTWQPDRKGLWKINADPHPETSASPFALECTPTDSPTLIRAGEEFWDDYRAKVAVNVLESPGGAGLAFNLTAGGGYLLRLVIEGKGSGGAGRAELVRLHSGGRKEEVLAARSLAGTPGSWYVLELGSVGGNLRAWVDGAELAALSGLHDLVGGRVGLWSSGRSSARFDDLRVVALELPADKFVAGEGLGLTLRRWFIPAPSLPKYFQQDRTMRSWAQIKNEYRPAGGGYWHRAQLAGPQEIAWERPGSPLSRGQLILALCADGKDFSSGYRMVADFGAGGANAAIVALFEKDQRVIGKVLPLAAAGLERLSFSREGGKLLARVGSRVVLTAPDRLKLRGGLAGARGLGGWVLQRQELATAAGNLFDEVFSRAPVNWRSATGRWEVASRWKCDPEYTWMLGRERRGLARIDLKRPVGGDFQLDLHFAVAMSQRCAPFYDFPTNLNVSLSPDPRQPTSGYVFAFGGIDVPAKIRRLGKIVSSGGQLVRIDARASGGGGGIHSHWFHVRIVRKGKRLLFYGDGEKLCDFVDAKPLGNANNLAVWTRNGNGVVMARFRLEATNALGARRSPFIDGRPVSPSKPPAALQHFVNRDGASGARLAFSKGEGARSCLRLENVNSGGSFAAAWAPPGGIDLAKNGWLSFNWKTSRGARVNLYLLRDGRLYRAALTAPAKHVGGRYNLRPLGSAPGAKAGGSKWQRFSYDLGAALASVEPGAKDLLVDEIRIGNYEFEDATLFEGYIGNSAGEWVEVANWQLSEAPPKGAGKPVRLAISPPAAASVTEKQRLGNFSRLDPRTACLTLKRRTVRYDGSALRYDAFSGVMTFTPRLAGHSLSAGENPISLEFNDFVPKNLNSSVRCNLRFDPKLDKRPPTLPRLVSPAPLEYSNFEKSLGAWRGFGGSDGAQLVLDSREAKYGRRCLLAENRRCGGTIAATARSRPFDVKRYPTLCFDYRVERYTHVNLLLFTFGERHDIRLSDSRGGAYNLGSIPGAAADGRWHRAAIDIQEALRWRRRTIVRAIGFGDYGPGSSTNANAYRMDNWVMLPALNGKRAVKFSWGARDESGISGYAAVLDRTRTTTPKAKVTTASPTMSLKNGLEVGTWYLHVRARDKAGNWGPAAHWRFKVSHHDDTAPPRVKSVSPPDGATECPRYVEVTLEEPGSGVSAHDVVLRVGNRVFRPGEAGVTFYPGERRIRAELTGFDGRLLVKPGRLKCSVRATDYAGNIMPTHSWTWNLQLSEDRAAPPAPRVIYLPSDRLVFQDFEREQGSFCNWRRGTIYRQRVRSRGEAGLGRWYVATNGRRMHDNNNEVQLWPAAFDPNRYSYLAFDYRMTRLTSFSFLLQIGNMHRQLDFGRLSGGRTSPLGKLPRPVRDSRWHRLEVDLRALRARFPTSADGNMQEIQKLLGLFHNQKGADLDNFVLASPYGRNPEFIWEAPVAASGVNGYSWKLDSERATVPPERVTGTTTRARFRRLEPGTYYLHLRARSGAGLWGDTTHSRFQIERRP